MQVGFSCFLYFCFFVKLALVDGARHLHNSEISNLQASLKCRNGLRHHSLATWWLLYSLNLIFRLVLHCYIGSTILRLHKRQDTRIRNLRQLLLRQPVHAELKLHWQVSRKLFSLVVLPIANMDTKRQIRTLEGTLIQRWNASLNCLLRKESNLQGRP